MATKPDMLFWVPDNDAAKIQDPGGSKKSTGFIYKEKPAFQFVNYLFNRIYKWFLGLTGSYYQVIVGSASQITAGSATHTINQLTDLVVTAGTKVLVLEGTHTLTADRILTSDNCTFTMENTASIIDLSSTYKFGMNGARAHVVLKFSNVTVAADAVQLSGAASLATLFDVTPAKVTSSATSIVYLPGTSPTGKIGGVDVAQLRSQSKSAAYQILRGDNGSIIGFDTSAAARTATLPDGGDIDTGFVIGVSKETNDVNAVTVAATSGDTIGGATSVTLSTFTDSIFLVWDGVSNWKIVSLQRRTGIIKDPSILNNIGLAVSVAANALTVALKGQDLANPSSTNIVEAGFRSVVAATGTFVLRTITAAASIVAPQDATFGFTSSETGFLYVYLVDNGSTRQVGLSKKALFDESNLHNTTAIDANSDSDIVLYTTAAVTGAAVRLVGRITIQSGSTPGNWSNNHTHLELWTPSMKKTGDIVQRITHFRSDTTDGVTAIPDDNSIPQIGEGDEYFSKPITPKSALNTIRVEASLVGAHSANGQVITAVFVDSGPNAIIADKSVQPAVGNFARSILILEFLAGSTSTKTISVRAGGNNGATFTLNGQGSGTWFGGVLSSRLVIEEIQA